MGNPHRPHACARRTHQRAHRARLRPRVSAGGELLAEPQVELKDDVPQRGVAFGAALAGGAIAGPMGAFTALPVAALISSFVSNYLASHTVVYESPDQLSPGTPRERRCDDTAT